MDYLEKNIEVIKALRPPFYQKLKTYMNNNRDETSQRITSIATKDDISALVVNTEHGMTRLNSVYHPKEEANRFIQKYNFTNMNSVVEMFGFGNGLFLREALNKISKDDYVIVYEPDAQLFMFSLSEYDLSDLFLDTRLLVSIEGINELSLDDYLLRRVYWYNMLSQYVVIHPQYEKIYAEQFIWFLQRLQSNNERAVINRNTDSFLGKLSVNNMLKNLPYIINSNIVSDIGNNIPKEIPAIIVAAGPSLNKNIEDLKLAKGKAVIFAVDTCLRFLEQHGVVPDFIVTIDPRKRSGHFESSLVKSVPLIAKLEAKPEALVMHTDRKVFYSSHEFLNSLYRKMNIIMEDYTSGGSVATAAFSVCVAMGFQTIVLVGQDLAFDGEYTHIGDRKQAKGVDVGVREVEGIDGNMVKTRYDWAIYLDWFAGAIESVPNTQCIDATEGGAKIPGTIIMTLKEVIKEKCHESIDVKEIMDQTKPTLDRVKVEQMNTMLWEAVTDLGEIKSKAGEAVSAITKFLDVLQKKGLAFADSQECSLKIAKISGHIEHKPVYQVIDTYMAEFARKELKDIYRLGEGEYEDTRNVFQQAKALYQEMIRSCEEIRPLLKQAVEEFEKRKEHKV